MQPGVEFIQVSSGLRGERVSVDTGTYPVSDPFEQRVRCFIGRSEQRPVHGEHAVVAGACFSQTEVGEETVGGAVCIQTPAEALVQQGVVGLGRGSVVGACCQSCQAEQGVRAGVFVLCQRREYPLRRLQILGRRYTRRTGMAT